MFNINKKYETPSGLGGVFTLRYLMKNNNKYHFQVTNPGFKMFLEFTENEAKYAITEIEEKNI